jgi:hypothetical protein
MELVINNNIYQQASVYAKQRGISLSNMVEKFLLQVIRHSQSETSEAKVPDVVLSLLGAGEQIADSDINGRGEYYKYLEEKYK